MILAYTAIFVAAFALLIYKDLHFVTVVLSLTISAIFYIHQFWIAKKYTIQKMRGSDLPFQLIFAVWLLFFKPPYFMHYIPLILGNIGRIYIMAVYKTGEITTISQELIIFQNQCQTFIFIISLFEVFSFSKMWLIQLLFLALFLKIKYKLYAPSRKAFNEMHFYFDRLSRNLSLRSIYHIMYEFISLFSNDVQAPVHAMDIYY